LGERFAYELEDAALASARLLVSELVTNAVVHGCGGIVLGAWSDRDCLHVEVRDAGKRFVQAIQARDRNGAGGRGLTILAAEATRWGIAEEATTLVWFELDRTGPRVAGVD
jgi:anti-sigma regulatory factor (Ser/Thr protein kinase)